MGSVTPFLSQPGTFYIDRSAAPVVRYDPGPASRFGTTILGWLPAPRGTSRRKDPCGTRPVVLAASRRERQEA
ncbi:MAG TPA: hypothetical protein VLM91_13590 [Candidatus Methylomirabilis sp.]|nr:hypothetical protein [Candidatus Methylomirabilis sp.]